jgi:quercetin dioxygenase-like cupin family protein
MAKKVFALKKKMEFVDPVMTDPKHYSVEFENESVRVVRISYGPHERSDMHDHPDGVAVFLTDQQSKFIYPGGESEILRAKAGEVKWMDSFTHMPENIAAESMELIYVEIKK